MPMGVFPEALKLLAASLSLSFFLLAAVARNPLLTLWECDKSPHCFYSQAIGDAHSFGVKILRKTGGKFCDAICGVCHGFRLTMRAAFLS